MARSHRELIVWRRAMELTSQVYALTRGFPPEERFGLSAQLQRAAVSVPANIAEGNARGSSREYAHFLSIARGSLMEVETLLLVAEDLGYLDTPLSRTARSSIHEISRMLFSLRARLLEP